MGGGLHRCLSPLLTDPDAEVQPGLASELGLNLGHLLRIPVLLCYLVCSTTCPGTIELCLMVSSDETKGSLGMMKS
jgi:hypothetical protein